MDSGKGGLVGIGLLTALFAGTAVLAKSSAGPPGSDARNFGQRYAIDATVLETSNIPGRRVGHGPQLCAGGIATSLPPQCGGFPVEPFRWADVVGKESLNGTTWAQVHLVGTFDGHAFHPTAPPSPPGQPPPQPLPASPCAPPPGGWTVVDESKSTEPDLSAAFTYADSQPDIGASWGSWPKGLPESKPSWPAPEGGPSHHDMVLNLAFTMDLDRHTREARARWGGALCVTQVARTRAELTRVSDDLFTADAQTQAAQHGVFLLGGGPDEPTNVVKVEVLIADEVAQRWVDNRYGPGTVVLEGRLRPIN
ncbi:MAG: hypothetical protein LC792_03365 [Actinobacteria bacterium]|nr:hypothetical protein [Actinomycetota bacterium]